MIILGSSGTDCSMGMNIRENSVYSAYTLSYIAVAPVAKIAPIFAIMRELRFSDETIYLRAVSLSLCNGMVH